MGFEIHGSYEQLQKVENNENLKYDLGFLNSSQNKLEGQMRDYVLQEKESGRDVTELTKDLNELVEKQRNENESLEKNIKSETKENLDKEALVNEARTSLYEKLGINTNLESNSNFENFLKGFVDEAIVGNYDLAVEIFNTGGQVILDSLSQLASWEGLKNVAASLGESIWDLLSGDMYEKGKSFAELGLLTTGAGLGVMVGKKGLKLGMKKISKLRLNKENLVNAPEVKQVVGEVSDKIGDIVPKKELDFEKLLKDDILKLGDKERLEYAKATLGREITEEQSEAIIKAHNIGEVGKYTFAQLKEKVTILENAGFDNNEIRTMLEKGICGKENLPDMKLLVDKYKFLKNERYSELLEELGDIDESQVVGEGVNALIINNLENSSKVRKISKIGKDDVSEELKNHNQVYDILKEIKSGNKNYDNIKIPRLEKSGNDVSFFMEKVQGHTPKSDFYLSLYKDDFIKAGIGPDELVGLSDEYIDKFLKENRLQRLPEPGDRFITPNEKRMEGLLQEWWNKEYDSEKFTTVRQVIDEIEEKGGIKIMDRNPGNFMFTPDGEIYIIDFGQIEIK